MYVDDVSFMMLLFDYYFMLVTHGPTSWMRHGVTHDTIFLRGVLLLNKKMQHSCGVTYSIALSYQFQNTTILVNLFQLH